jgi:type II secretory pathway component PulF
MSLAGDFLIKRDFGMKFRRKLWKKMSVYAKYNIPQKHTLQSLHNRAVEDKRPRAAIYAHILKNMDAGKKFGIALMEYASSEEVQLILAAETSGSISEGFKLAGELLENKSVIKKAIAGACAYPAFLGLLSIGLMVMISVYVLPQLAEVSNPEAWTGAAGALYSISTFVTSPAGIGTGIAMTLGFAAMFFTFPNWTGPLRLKVDNLGPWGIYRILAGSSWLFSMGTMMRAGVPIKQILTEMTMNCTAYMKERLTAILHELDKGKDLGACLRDCGYNFPSRDTVDDIIAYSTLPDFASQLFGIATEQISEDIEAIQSKMSKLKTLLLFAVAVEAGLLLSAITSLQSQLSV